jgi:type II secretory pathway predicted ATPase ExeA
MYRPFFGFSRVPFEREPVADKLFRSAGLDEAHARLTYLVEMRAIGLLYSEPGCGKTTALRRLRESLHPDQVRAIYVHYTNVGTGDFLKQLAGELGLVPSFNHITTFRAVQQEIARITKDRRLTVLIVIDEAHRLRPEVMADLPSLCNFDWDSGARLALLLCGQVGLRQRLRLADLEALAQRITVRCTLRGVDRETTRAYIEHRLRVAGADRPIFSEPGFEAMFGASQGVFRRIDVLAHNALAVAASANARIVDADHVLRAAEEVRA